MAKAKPFLKILPILLGLSAFTPCFAKNPEQIKAAYIYNFLKFIDWPKTYNDKPHAVCVFNSNSMFSYLSEVENRNVKGRPIFVVKTSFNDDISACTVLYIPRDARRHSLNLLDQTVDLPILTISDTQNFIHSHEHAIIELHKLGNIIKFKVNLKQARLKQLSISSKLLQLASEVLK